MKILNIEQIKNFLDINYTEYKKRHSSKDPVWLLHTLNESKDIEIMGLITSCYAYGKVEQIIKYTSAILQIIKKPYEFTINFQKQKDRKYLDKLAYRFSKGEDLAELFNNISVAIEKNKSLEKTFIKYYSVKDLNVINASIGFINELTGFSNVKKHSYRYLLPNPINGSTCKRLFLYLRWMIRNDEIDTGIWKSVPVSKLIIPVDTHIARISKLLGLVKRNQVDLKFAIELTNSLKQFDKNDPVKYDFSLCHIGIEKKEIFFKDYEDSVYKKSCLPKGKLTGKGEIER